MNTIIAGRFGTKTEADAAAGKLDKLADEALAEYRAGKATEI